MVSADPTTNTMTQANSNTTTVLRAVATSESVFLIPHFARIDVIPAKNADRTAITIHIFLPPPLCSLGSAPCPYPLFS